MCGIQRECDLSTETTSNMKEVDMREPEIFEQNSQKAMMRISPKRKSISRKGSILYD